MVDDPSLPCRESLERAPDRHRARILTTNLARDRTAPEIKIIPHLEPLELKVLRLRQSNAAQASREIVTIEKTFSLYNMQHKKVNHVQRTNRCSSDCTTFDRNPLYTAASTSAASAVAGGDTYLCSATRSCSAAVSCAASPSTQTPPDAHTGPSLNSWSIQQSEVYTSTLWPSLCSPPVSFAFCPFDMLRCLSLLKFHWSRLTPCLRGGSLILSPGIRYAFVAHGSLLRFGPDVARSPRQYLERQVRWRTHARQPIKLSVPRLEH